MGRLQNIAISIKNFRYTKYLITIALFVIIVVFVDENSLMNQQERSEEIERLQEEISILKAQYEEDTRKLNSLSEYDHIVRMAREKYFMKRPDEDVFVVNYVSVDD